MTVERTPGGLASSVLPANPSSRLSSRRALVVGGMTVAGGGLAFNWDWLTAVGAAPILLSLAPCILMCALGMCMRGGASNTCRKAGGTLSPEEE